MIQHCDLRGNFDWKRSMDLCEFIMKIRSCFDLSSGTLDRLVSCPSSTLIYLDYRAVLWLTIMRRHVVLLIFLPHLLSRFSSRFIAFQVLFSHILVLLSYLYL